MSRYCSDSLTHRFAPRFISSVFALSIGTANAGPIFDFTKVFYAAEVLPSATMEVGTSAQTWGGNSIKRPDTITIADGPPPVQRDYIHAEPVSISFSNLPIKPYTDLLGTVLPISSLTATTELNGAEVFHFNPPGRLVIGDTHRNPNTSSISITADPRVDSVFIPVKPESGTGDPTSQELKNALKIVMKGKGEAGTITDNHQYHSADAFGGASLVGLKSFFVGQLPANRPVFTAVSSTTTMVAGVSVVELEAALPAALSAHAAGRDPIFMSVVDVTDPAQRMVLATEVLARQTIDVEASRFSMDDSGIRMTIARGNPASVVSLFYETVSPWVLNPLSYGATLTNEGLFAFGATPFEGWTITDSDTLIEAFFAFGSSGQPFDFVEALPPASLFQAGRTYAYDGGAGNGAFAWVQAVPEPATWTLWLAALAVWPVVSRFRE